MKDINKKLFDKILGLIILLFLCGMYMTFRGFDALLIICGGIYLIIAGIYFIITSNK